MDEDQILQSIIADPQLTDPSIDTSGLRTTTDTRAELLANVPEFSGLKYDFTNRDYIRDLYSVYGGGLPTIPEPVVEDTAQIPGAVDTLVDVGGGGGGSMDQVTGGSVLDTPTITQPVGGGADMATVPATEQVGGITGDPIEVGIPDNESGFVDPLGTISGAPVIGDFSEPTTGTISDDRLNEVIGGQPMAAGPFDYLQEQTPISQVQAPGLDYSQAEIDAERLANYTTPEQQNLISQAFSKVGSTANDIMRDLSEIPGAVADFVNKTVDIAGQKINVGGTLLKAGINKLAGGPISLVFDAISNIQPSVSQIEYESYDQGQKNAIDNAYGPGGVMDGYNAVSAFGKGPKETVQERLETRTSNGIFDDTTDKLNDLAEKLGGTRIDPPAYDFDDISKTTTTPGGDTVDVETGDITDTTGTIVGNVFDEVALTGGDGQDTGPPEGPGATADEGFGQIDQGEVSSDVGFGQIDQGEVSSDAGFSDTGFAGEGSGAQGPAGGASNAAADAQAAANRDAARGGGGGSSGGGKIVCTMMNESYGFGSFRNKIWLRHSKDLAPEYQKGYHKIFLPLVKLSKNNKVLKIMLEHIAVHRTIDIRQESRGKVHLLGRVYRKILEPICYWVGKHD